MKPFLLEGASAFSPFRVESLTHALAARLPSLANATIQATFVYLLDLARPLDDEPERRTRALLNAGTATIRAGGFFVTPRKGTVSPWSS